MIIEIPSGYRATLRPVTAQDDAILSALDRMWSAIRQRDERIPAVLIELTPGRSSSCRSVDWAGQPVIELNLMSDGSKRTGRDLLQSLLHQAGHALAGVSTSMEGRFHPKTYRDTVEQVLGLTAEQTATGFSDTELARGTVTRYRAEVDQLDRALKSWEPVEVRKRQRSAVMVHCQCDPPRSVRIRASDVGKRDVVCTRCGQPFDLHPSPSDVR
jgi:hypothetical protein